MFNNFYPIIHRHLLLNGRKKYTLKLIAEGILQINKPRIRFETVTITVGFHAPTAPDRYTRIYFNKSIIIIVFKLD